MRVMGSMGPRFPVHAGALSGLLAGVLTVVVPTVIAKLGSPLYLGLPFGLFVGDIFGAVIAAYFWLYFGSRSLVRALGFILASAVAYIAAFFSTLYSMPLCRWASGSADTGGLREIPVSLTFFIGGTAGSLLVIFAAQLLFSRQTVAKAFRVASAWCALGGVFGIAGWALAPSLGGVTFTLISPPPSYADEMATYAFSCFLIWQTGMGAVLSMLAAKAPIAESALDGARRSSWLVLVRRIFVGAFFVTLLIVVVHFAKTEVPQYVQSVRWHRAYEKHLAEIPSSAQLPAVERLSIDHMLIMEPIDGYVPTSPIVGQTREGIIPTTDKHTPSAERYFARYQRSDAPARNLDGPFVDVELKEYPTADWANWLLSEQGVTISSLPKSTVFGNIVFGNTHLTDRNHAFYIWVSGTRVLNLSFRGIVPDDFLKDYLQKYPSSLTLDSSPI